ncbi:hypothetical protein Tco_1372087, partial [Tanacetum coccineum]
DDDGGVDGVAVVRIAVGVDGVVWLIIREVDDGCRGVYGGVLRGRPGHLSIAAEYFFNNDLEFLKSFDREKKYTTSITKTKVARYEIVGIEDMTPTLWSTIKHGYDKDAKKGIKH